MMVCRPDSLSKAFLCERVMREASQRELLGAGGGWDGMMEKKKDMNALSAAASYYRAAGRRVEEMEEDGRCQDVYIRTPELVMMARKVDSSAPFRRIVDVRCRFEPERCDAWHLHFLAGQARELLVYEREILSLPWILTQHGKRGDGRLVKLSSSRFCRLLGASERSGALSRYW